MDEALIGFVGVVVGALVTGLATYLSARRGEKHTLMLRRRGAARLIKAEVLQGQYTVTFILEEIEEQMSRRGANPEPSKQFTQRLASGHVSEISDVTWWEQRHHLAEALDFGDWHALDSAHEAITALPVREMVQGVVRAGSVPAHVDAYLLVTLKDIIERNERALRAVGKLTAEGEQARR